MNVNRVILSLVSLVAFPQREGKVDTQKQIQKIFREARQESPGCPSFFDLLHQEQEAYAPLAFPATGSATKRKSFTSQWHCYVAPLACCILD